MSEYTQNWTEEEFRSLLRALDAKTGLKGAELPIRFDKLAGSLGIFVGGKDPAKWALRFNLRYFNDPKWAEIEAINVVRHEYAHYYVDAAGVEKYIRRENNCPHHGLPWKWACGMVGSKPIRCHDPKDFKDDDHSFARVEALRRADDVRRLDILSFVRKWNALPPKEEDEIRMLDFLRKNEPLRFFEPNDEVLHPQRGFGIVDDRVALTGKGLLVSVFFEDNTEGVFHSSMLCRVENGTVLIPA